MEEIKQFIVSNYQFIVLGIVALIQVILALFRKKSKVEIFDDSATSSLVDLTIEAEMKYGSGNGKEKLDYVYEKFVEKHPSLKPYRKAVVNLVEHILSSPQKKG